MTLIPKSVLAGMGLSAVLTYVLFTNVTWYHDLFIWSWTNPWMWAIALPIGIGAAVLTDD